MTEGAHGEDRDDGAYEAADVLERELRMLGRGLPVPDVDGETMAERVLAQLLAESAGPPAAAVPPGRWRRAGRRLRRRWRALTAGLSGVLVVLVLTPPVRATVADWFGFGGVEVRYDPSAPPRTAAPVPWCHGPAGAEGLADAGRRAGFTPSVPGALGAPDAVSVSEGPAGRTVVSLCWREDGGTVRLDQFPARLDMGLAKEARARPQWLTLGSEGSAGTGLWFAEPHTLRFGMTDARGATWVRSERTAGPTLLWTVPDAATTLRLEGVAELPRAREIAESTGTDSTGSGSAGIGSIG